MAPGCTTASDPFAGAESATSLWPSCPLKSTTSVITGTPPILVTWSDSTPPLSIVPALAALTTVASTFAPLGTVKPAEVFTDAASTPCTMSPLRCTPEFTASLIRTLTAVPIRNACPLGDAGTGLDNALLSTAGSAAGVSSTAFAFWGVLAGAVGTVGLFSDCGTGTAGGAGTGA